MKAGAKNMGRGNHWCILRTSGASTLRLAASLSAAGLDVWTPKQVTVRRKGRDRVRVERDAPIMPTFVFVRAAHLPALVDVLALPVSPHPPFSIFRHAGRVPLVGESEIMGARQEEEKAQHAIDANRRAEAGRTKQGKKDAKRRVMATGAEVTIPDGAFAGLTGVVESSDRKHAWVNFGAGLRMKIDTWLLADDVVMPEQPVWASAA